MTAVDTTSKFAEVLLSRGTVHSCSVETRINLAFFIVLFCCRFDNY